MATRPIWLIGLGLMACNEPPTAPTVEILPASPNTLDDLTVNILEEAVDENGDTIEYKYAWELDGTAQEGLTDAVLPADQTSRGQRWTVIVTPFDGKLDGIAASTTVTIGNAAPSATVSITPESPLATDSLEAVIVTEDADGDSVNPVIAWTRDGEPTGITNERVPADRTKRGETWEITVTPKDARDEGEPTVASVVIANQAPEITRVSLRPALAYEGSVLDVVVNASDPDGDFLTYRATWSVNGTALPESEDLTLTGVAFDRDDEVTVSIVANDGVADSAPFVSEAVTILNTPPKLTSAAIVPDGSATDVYTDTPLKCEVTGWSDDDGDAEQLQFEWNIGSTTVGTEATLSPDAFSRGDRISCIVTPFDGRDTGVPVVARPITVLNSPPSVAEVSIAPEDPTTGTEITHAVSGAVDADGDTISTSVKWYVNGAYRASGPTLTGTSYVKGQDIYAEVTPNDGTEDGTPVKSNVITAVNAPPAITTFTVDPGASSYTDQAISLTVATEDLDLDTVTLTYAWTKNGASYGTTSTTSVPTSDTTRGDSFAVTVTPNDGAVDGTARSATIDVVNKPPSTPVISVTPDPPRGTNNITCAITKASTDADGDAVTTTLSWNKNGAAYTGTTTTTTITGDTIPSSETKDGDTFECVVSADDGTAKSTAKKLVTVKDRDGQVRTVSGTWLDVLYVECGSGGSCNATQAESACTAKGLKVVSHGSNGTSAVKSLGATTSCNWSISYFTTETARPTSECLVGISNLRWSSCCGTSRWHGNTVGFGTAKTVFGYVSSGNSGYVSTYTNRSGNTWGCNSLSTAASKPSTCTKAMVACEL